MTDIDSMTLLPTSPEQMTPYQKELFQVAYAGALRDQANQAKAADMAEEFIRKVSKPFKFQRLVIIGLPFVALTIIIGTIIVAEQSLMVTGIAAGIWFVLTTVLILAMRELDNEYLRKSQIYLPHGNGCRCQTCDPAFDRKCKFCRDSHLVVEEHKDLTHRAQLKAAGLEETVKVYKARQAGVREVSQSEIMPPRKY